MSLVANLTMRLTATQKSVLPFGTKQATPDFTASVTYHDGSGSGAANGVFADRRTLAAGANEDLDLNAILPGQLGETLSFTRVKAIYLKPASSNGGTVTVKPAAANGFVGPFGGSTQSLTVPSGGIVLLVDPGVGWAVTPGTGDKLNVANNDGVNPAVYDVWIIGE